VAKNNGFSTEQNINIEKNRQELKKTHMNESKTLPTSPIMGDL